MGLRLFMRSACSHADVQEPRKVATVTEHGTEPDNRTYFQLLKELREIKELVTIQQPDPSNYELLSHVHVGSHLVVKIRYPDCSNYEGEKILLYSNITLDELLEHNALDPHFCDREDCISPVARFEPTVYGWKLAMRTAQFL